MKFKSNSIMALQNTFDLAKKEFKGGSINEGFLARNGKIYEAYLTREQWNSYLAKMKSTHPDAFLQYKNGGGSELKEDPKTGYPPKMASYGSSSRFVYELLNEASVIFEQKLPTGVPHSISNMDAFSPRNNVFIEAKCREIYAAPNPKYKIAFKQFYDMLATRTGFSYHPSQEKNDAAIHFCLNGEPIEQFDIKQFIAHTLGIAYACMNGVEIEDKKEMLNLDKGLTFIYLLYNPKELQTLLDQSIWKTIMGEYNREVSFIKEHKAFFKDLFHLSLEYLGCDADLIGDLAKKYTFKLADQYTIWEESRLNNK